MDASHRAGQVSEISLVKLWSEALGIQTRRSPEGRAKFALRGTQIENQGAKIVTRYTVPPYRAPRFPHKMAFRVLTSRPPAPS